MTTIASRNSKIAIVGAGPAGSTLAIRLAQKGFETTLVEKERFPREKLCGEFISPECFKHFRDVGVLDSMMAAGGDRIYETRFYETGGRSVVVPSSWFGDSAEFALGLSRAEMDFRLLERAKRAGVTVIEGTTVTELRHEGGRIKGMTGRSDDGTVVEVDADIFVDATGRAGTLARLVEGRQPGNRKKPSIVGFKAHISGVDLEPGGCEIYSFPGGYAGLQLVEGESANLCFMVKSDVVRSMGSDAGSIVEKVVRKNRRAAQTIGQVSNGNWLAVSITGFGTKHVAPLRNLFSVGDAAAFIDPFTGSGMVMAMESAALLAGAIERRLDEPGSIGKEYANHYRRHFARRLRVCSVLRRTAFMPRLATVVVAGLAISPAVRRFLARSTRS